MSDLDRAADSVRPPSSAGLPGGPPESQVEAERSASASPSVSSSSSSPSASAGPASSPVSPSGGRPPARSPAPTVAAPTVAAPTISLENVVFDYPGSGHAGGTRALDGVTLSIPPGQRVAIVGQNGSGKSTLVRHLDGLLRPTSGRVLLDGRDIRHEHVARLAGIVGLAFQNPDRQLFAGRVAAEVAFGPRNLGARGADVDRRVALALSAVGLAGESETNPYDLGYSRRKLLAIASVLAMETPVLVLDEPTTGQDARGVACVRSVVGAAAEAGRTVVAISHDMRFVAECFERVVVMRAGRVVLDGSVEFVFGEPQWPELRAAFLEPPLAAVVGARLGLGSTPTEDALVAAMKDELIGR